MKRTPMIGPEATRRTVTHHAAVSVPVLNPPILINSLIFFSFSNTLLVIILNGDAFTMVKVNQPKKLGGRKKRYK